MDEEDKPRQRTPQIFLDEVSKTEEALKSFTEIRQCSYQYKYLGSSGQTEYMTCECKEIWDSKLNKNLACSEDSGCINRATSVECYGEDCGCGKDCENQQFQKQIYKKVTVFQTEKKGYGLRADEKISESSFIYEYTGEVINEDTFRKRMITYDAKKFKHFYFMMLNKDSFIDATIKGSLARFVNHSCNPNAYVDKWVVGDKLRMGIFAKRTIQKGEELTFDYNVDRYGAQSQPCYCGELSCIKFMGGKTQTDAALLLPEGISEALGVTVEQEKTWLKENKHLRSKQQKADSNINEQFVKSIEVLPLEDHDVTKVMSSLMKSQDLQIIKKLIERIYLTNDEIINLSIVKIHGYKTLSKLLQQELLEIDDELIIKILQILIKWPKLTRNKISSSKIEDNVKEINNSNKNKQIKSLSNELLNEWLKLQMAYRIPKKNDINNMASYSRHLRSQSIEYDSNGENSANTPIPMNSSSTNNSYNNNGDFYSATTNESNNNREEEESNDLPPGWRSQFSDEYNAYYYYNVDTQETRWEKPQLEFEIKHESPPIKASPRIVDRGPSIQAQMEEERLQREKMTLYNENQQKQKLLQDLIIQSQREADERKKLNEEKLKNELAMKEKAKSKKSKHRNGSSDSHHPHHRHSSGHSSKPINNEKLWGSVFAQHIPNFVKKHESEIGRDNVKGCARDIVKLLTEKEITKDSNKTPPKELDNAKLKKIKEFTKSYMEKFLLKYRSKHRRDDINNDSKKAKQH